MRKKLRLMACILAVAMLCGCANKSASNETVTYGAIERAGNYSFKITPNQFVDLFNEKVHDEKNKISDCQKIDGEDWTKYEYELNDNGALMLFVLNNSEYISGVQIAAYDNTEVKEDYANIVVKLINSSYDFETILDWLSEEGSTDSNGNYNSSIYRPFGEYEIMFALSVFFDATGDAPKNIFGYSATPKDLVLTAGTYEVGVDLGEGNYDIYVKKGSGTCSINSGEVLDEKFCFDADGISSYRNAKLQKGDIVKISGNVELRFYPNE